MKSGGTEMFAAENHVATTLFEIPGLDTTAFGLLG